MNEKLKPCPFCGGEAKLIDPYVSTNRWAYFIECQNCKATKGYYQNKKVAINAWNTRVDCKPKNQEV